GTQLGWFGNSRRYASSRTAQGCRRPEGTSAIECRTFREVDWGIERDDCIIAAVYDTILITTIVRSVWDVCRNEGLGFKFGL
ncbi:UNVERIFIED_CONTAM: hypothetical protein Slati_2643200, partial [Sesamum latifolium]